jgi:AcrR family transcriptional regulator
MNVAPRELTEQGRERQLQLLDCARDLFADRGYAATRIVDICAAAGVAKGLFYWYFPTKETLFAELVRSMRLRLRRAQADGIDHAADPLTRICQGAEASVRFMAANASFFALLDHESGQNLVADLLLEGRQVHTRDVVAQIAEAQAQHLVDPDEDTAMLGTAVIGAVTHFSHAHRLGQIDQPIDVVAAFVGRWVRQALVPPNILVSGVLTTP